MSISEISKINLSLCVTRGGLAIVAMRCWYKMSKKEPFGFFSMECRRGLLIPVRSCVSLKLLFKMKKKSLKNTNIFQNFILRRFPDHIYYSSYLHILVLCKKNILL
jgi:hypothetical protein